MALATNVTFNLVGQLTGAASIAGSGTPGDTVQRTLTLALASGVLLNQADSIYEVAITLAASASTTVQLNGGAITNDLGAVFSVARVKALLVDNTANTTAGTTISVGNATTPYANWISPSTAVKIVDAGGYFFDFSPSLAGFAVATNGGLKLTNNGAGSVTVNLIVIGASS